jgi:hypothetical protein
LQGRNFCAGNRPHCRGNQISIKAIKAGPYRLYGGERRYNMKTGDKIKVHIYSSNREVQTRHKDTIFEVYKKNGKLGIDWNTDRSPYTCKGDIFTPFYTFADTVIFENVETGERYHWDNISDSLQPYKGELQ